MVACWRMAGGEVCWIGKCIGCWRSMGGWRKGRSCIGAWRRGSRRLLIRYTHAALSISSMIRAVLPIRFDLQIPSKEPSIALRDNGTTFSGLLALKSRKTCRLTPASTLPAHLRALSGLHASSHGAAWPPRTRQHFENPVPRLTCRAEVQKTNK